MTKILTLKHYPNCKIVSRSLETLSSRLLGGQARSGLPEPLPSLHGSQAASDSPAEADLKRLLARPLSLEAKIPDQASSRLAKVRILSYNNNKHVLHYLPTSGCETALA